MKLIPHYTLAAMLALSGPAVLAAEKIDHAAHHAGVAMPSATSSAAAASERAEQESMMKMDAQMKSMDEMHSKMMNAKSPEERKAMMADHMKTMQDSMKMMGGMGAPGGMGDMSGMHKMEGKASSKMASHHQMMEKRMDMMEMMMRMMMDRLPAQ